MDEGEGVDELERGRRGQRALGLRAGRLCRGQADCSPYALAAGRRVPKRLLERTELRRQREVADIGFRKRAQLVRAPHRPRL